MTYVLVVDDEPEAVGEDGDVGCDEEGTKQRNVVLELPSLDVREKQ